MGTLLALMLDYRYNEYLSFSAKMAKFSQAVISLTERKLLVPAAGDGGILKVRVQGAGFRVQGENCYHSYHTAPQPEILNAKSCLRLSLHPVPCTLCYARLSIMLIYSRMVKSPRGLRRFRFAGCIAVEQFDCGQGETVLSGKPVRSLTL